MIVSLNISNYQFFVKIFDYLLLVKLLFLLTALAFLSKLGKKTF